MYAIRSYYGVAGTCLLQGEGWHLPGGFLDKLGAMVALVAKQSLKTAGDTLNDHGIFRDCNAAYASPNERKWFSLKRGWVTV